MRIRTLVPALAIIAAPLTAAETVKIDGFVDSVWAGSYSKMEVDTAGTTAESKFGMASQFSAQAKLGIAMTLSEKVKAQIDIVATGNRTTANTNVSVNDELVGHTSHTAVAETEVEDGILVRQAYGTWQVTPEVEFKSGKFISEIGWTAAYAPGLFRIGTGPIYDLYGQDEIGAAVTYSKDALRVAFDITNGFFGEAYNNTSENDDANQGKNAYAYTLDVGFTLPEKKGNVDVEFVYDANGGLEAPGNTTKSGDGIHLAANATLTPSEPLTVGAEVIWQTQQAPKDSDGESQGTFGLMAMANFKLAGTPFPMSVTGMVQNVSVKNVDGDEDIKSSDTELALALLTQPAGTDRLGVNAELTYTMSKAENDATDTEATGNTFAIAFEALYVLP